MSAQTTVDQTSRFEQLLADLKITSGDLTEVPQQLADVAQAGFDASTGTIADAGQHSGGDYSVELNNQNGGLPSPGRNGPFELAKAALLSQQCAAGRSTRGGDSVWRTGGPGGGLDRVAI